MKTKELQGRWNDWLKASDELLLILHEQTAAVTLRDVSRVERLQPKLEDQLARVAGIDAQAVDQAQRLAESLGTEPTLRGIVEGLDRSEGQALHALANRVTMAARKVQSTMEKNRALIENEMTYVNGTLTLIAKAAGSAPTPYRRRNTGPVLMDAAA
jgi:predicted transcriptional regulator